MNDVTLLLATEKDAELIHNMKYEAFLPLYEKYHDDATSPVKEKIDKVIWQLTYPGSEYYLIVVDGKNAGAVRVARKYVIQDGERVLLPDTNFISPIFILPEFQNRGIGQRVFEKLFELYGNVMDWRLDTIKQEAGNCHFYEKCGFVRGGEEKRVNERMSLVDYVKCNIRFAETTDYEAVERIMKQVQELHVGWRPDIYKPCDIAMEREEFEADVARKTFLVAELGDEVVGILSFMLRHVESGRQVTRDVLFIDVMAVDEEHRGRGIGHHLFGFVKRLAREKQLDGVELQVNARNEAAYRMYKSFGFTEKSINMELL